MKAQPGICNPSHTHALFLCLNRTDTFEAKTARGRLAQIPAIITAMATQNPNADLSGVLAVGSNIWDSLYPQRPQGLTDFPAMEANGQKAPSTPFDLHIHLHSERHDLNFELAREIFNLLKPMFAAAEDIHGFRYLDSRDLTGFVDGTENPTGDDRAEVALVADGPFASGAFLHVQRYVHHLKEWNALPVKDQEIIIGRTKKDDIEFPGKDKSPHAHTKRTSLKDNQGRSIEILRHSMPYGSVTEHGLYFVSYAKSPDPFTLMLKSMVYGDDQGRHDHLMDYTTAHTGAAFFAPSVTFLEQWR